MFKPDKPPVFETLDKKEVSLTMHQIKSWDDHGYGLSMSHFVNGEVEGGHEATIWGNADDYWRDGNEIRLPKLRMHIKLSSDLSRLQMERGIIGGGQFYDEYVEVELNLEPAQVRDIVYELRISSVRQVYVSGYAISDRIFRATRFGFSEPRDKVE